MYNLYNNIYNNIYVIYLIRIISIDIVFIVDILWYKYI
mgnify:CR=1 FL=1